MLGLEIPLTCFPSFHPRLASFNPGLNRVLMAVYRKLQHMNSVQAPLVPVLAHLMLHFIDEWEVFALLSHLLVRTAWLDYSTTHYAASHSTLVRLLSTHAVGAVNDLHVLQSVLL